MSEHRHLGDEELLELALNRGGVIARSVASCSTCAERLAESKQLAARMRGLLEHESALDARKGAALSERILALTAARRRPAHLPTPARVPSATAQAASTRAKQIAVAAALLAVAALSAIGWAALRSKPGESRQQSGWEASAPRVTHPLKPILPVAPSEPARALADERASVAAPRDEAASERVIAPSEPDQSLSESDDPAVERARERAALHAVEVPSFAGVEAGLSPPARMLALRSKVVRGAPASTEVNAATPSDEDGALVIALWCEVALDHWVLTDELVVGLRPLARHLARIQAEAPRPSMLVTACLERAQRCGLLDEKALADVAAARRAHPELDHALSLAPCDLPWRAVLREALAERSGSIGDGRSAGLFAEWTQL